jgi:hypothetical protein
VTHTYLVRVVVVPLRPQPVEWGSPVSLEGSGPPRNVIVEVAAGSTTRTRVHKQRQSGVLIGHDHDVVVAAVR